MPKQIVDPDSDYVVSLPERVVLEHIEKLLAKEYTRSHSISGIYLDKNRKYVLVLEPNPYKQFGGEEPT